MPAPAPSFDDLVAQGIAVAQGRRPDLIFAEGDVTTADVHAAAAMGDAVIRYTAQLFKITWIDGAKGADLTALVNDHLNIQRHPSTSAQGTLTLTRTSGGAGGTIYAGTTVASLPDAAGKQVQVVTDDDVIVPGGNNGPFTVGATALEVGSGGNAAAGTLVQIVGALFDATFTVTNETGFGGGNTEESDEDLRVRAHTFYSTLRRGTVDALEYGAKTVPTVRIAKVVEDDLSGMVTLLVSDADGDSSAQMVADVMIAIEDWRAAGIVVTVVGGSKILVDLQIGIVARRGFDVAAVADSLIAAVENRMNKLRGTERLYLDMVEIAIGSVYPDDILSVQFLAIVVDGEPAVYPDTLQYIDPGSAFVVRPGTITVEKIDG